MNLLKDKMTKPMIEWIDQNTTRARIKTEFSHYILGRGYNGLEPYDIGHNITSCLQILQHEASNKELYNLANHYGFLINRAWDQFYPDNRI